MDALADHGASKALKLEEGAVGLGLPGKIGGHGSEVRNMVAAGNLAGVRAYIDAAGHNATLQSLIDYLSAERATRPHVGEFLDQWRRSRRLAVIFFPVPTTE